MAFDFPSAPTNGQQVTGPNGALYQWDGTKWAVTTPASTLTVPVPVAQGGTGAITAPLALTNLGAAPAAALNNVGRNLVHNPLFNVAQRATGPFTGTGGYTLDRWQLQWALDTGPVSVYQVALADSIRAQIGDEAALFALQLFTTGNAAAGAYTEITHSIEGVRRLAGKTVTLSFWASGTPAGLKLGLSLYSDYGTGGSPSGPAGPGGTSITTATTWARYSVTFAVPTSVGKTLGTNGNDRNVLQIWLSSGANNSAAAGNIGVQTGTVQLWGVQLEIGSVATPLEKPDPQQDLAKCQRFYSQGNINFQMQGVAVQNFANTVSLPVWMRANPTITFLSPALVNCTGLGIVQYNPGQITVYALTTATAQTAINGNFTASADL